MTKKTGIFSGSKGSGKTTSCAYLAAALATMHRKVVCVDISGGLGNYFDLSRENTEVAGLSWKCRQWGGEEDRLDDTADYILVDMPAVPSPEQETLFSVLDSVIIPIEGEYYGLDELNSTVQKISEYENLLIEGFVLTKVDRNSRSSVETEAQLREYFSPFILNTIISRNYYLSVPEFSLIDLGGKGWHSGFIDYLKLANELIEHEC